MTPTTMTQQQIKIAMERLMSFFPNVYKHDPEVAQEFRNKIQKHSFSPVMNAIQTLIDTQRTTPTVADLNQLLPPLPKQAVVNDCRECEGTGWIFVNGTTVDDCRCSQRPLEVKRSDRRTTSSAVEPSSLDEAKARFELGKQKSEVF